MVSSQGLVTHIQPLCEGTFLIFQSIVFVELIQGLQSHPICSKVPTQDPIEFFGRILLQCSWVLLDVPTCLQNICVGTVLGSPPYS